MATSYRQIFYHIVFRTQNSLPTLPLEHCEELYRYIFGIVKGNEMHLYRINGMQEHVHLFTDMNPNIALADFLRDLKASSSLFLKKNTNFPDFTGWSAGYAALTYSWRDKDMIINYIKNQREHHKKVSFLDEYRAMLTECGVEIDERYFP